jgi:hypothetical protein
LQRLLASVLLTLIRNSLWIEQSLTTEGDVADDIKRDRVSSDGKAINEFKLTLLRLAGPSGMQLTGKRDSNADHDDSLLPIKLGLAEEVGESCIDFFHDVLHLMSEMKAKDSFCLKSTNFWTSCTKELLLLFRSCWVLIARIDLGG